MKAPRTIAVGDIHGHAAALAALVAAIQPQPDDTLVFLGDYVDRGPDSRGVLNQLIELSQRLTVVALMGNHEESMLAARRRPSNLDFWLSPVCGGLTTLESYGPAQDLSLIPRSISDSWRGCDVTTRRIRTSSSTPITPPTGGWSSTTPERPCGLT